MVWLWGVLVLGLLIDISYQVLVLLAVDQAYKADEGELTQTLVNELLTFVAANALTAAIAAVGYDSWKAAQNYDVSSKTGSGGAASLFSL